ncbi:MAG: hypothetical protein D6748_14575 [Calditrichaeota bacterium]|nr:MAG: hypothetical protein D6748_14575 [Calditrichota bacterium]
MSTFNPNLESILGVMEHKGYKVYTNESGFDLNIVGIRTKRLIPNRFDDYLTVFYRMHGEWIFNMFNCTTDPGSYWLNNPEQMSSLGTAILKEGNYPKAYRLGRHRGKYVALVQNSPLPVVRDPNRDNFLDLDSGREEIGLFGINIHRASAHHESLEVNRWSAGCQVLCDPNQYAFFIKLCRQGQKAFGNSFTYTLLNEKDFD